MARAAGATCFVVEKAAELEPALEAASVESGIRLVLVDVDPELGLRRREELDGAIDAVIGNLIADTS